MRIEDPVSYWSGQPSPGRRPLKADAYIEVGRLWKTIPLLQYGNRFEISFDGLVRSVRTKRPRLQRINHGGYRVVQIEGRGRLVHRLLAFTFLGFPEDTERGIINHVNGDKSDNRIVNIEWCSQKENMLHAYRTGLAKRRFGSENHYAKLSEAAVLDIRRRYDAGGVKQHDLAEEFGVSQRMVSLIVRREKWQHV